MDNWLSMVLGEEHLGKVADSQPVEEALVSGGQHLNAIWA